MYGEKDKLNSQHIISALEHPITNSWLKKFQCKDNLRQTPESWFRNFVTAFELEGSFVEKTSLNIYDLSSFEEGKDLIFLNDDKNNVFKDKTEFEKYVKGNQVCIDKRNNKLMKNFRME